MIGVQSIIHSLEEGRWAKRIHGLVLLLLLVCLGLVYNLNLTRNFTLPEAMDTAQLARNIAEGRGYTTGFIRPLSLDVLRQHAAVSEEELREAFPDITNPPLYPYLLAGWMKLLPFEFKTDESLRYQPEVLINLLNQFLFFIALVQVFRLGKRLFDSSVAWCAILVFLGTELYWKFSVSGLPTTLLLVLFLALVKVLIMVAEEEKDGVKRRERWIAGMALWAGVLVGLGGLTRYGFAWVILPVLFYFGCFLGRQRGRAILMALLGFLFVMSPWLGRNMFLSGKPFGSAGLALYSQTYAFPEDTLERTLFYEPSAEVTANGHGVVKTGVADHVGLWDIANKIKRNLRHLFVYELPNFSGGWFGVVCLIGLVVPFRRDSIRRLRVFLWMTFAVFSLGQALGQGYASTSNTTLDSLLVRSLGQAAPLAPPPDVSCGNLLAVLGPVAFLFGAGLFVSLLAQWKVDLPEMRLVGFSGLVLAAWLPLLLSFFLPHPYPLADAPYHPARIQYLSSLPRENDKNIIGNEDLLMSDIPWAVAWYGNRDCAWLTRNVEPDFYALNDQFRPVEALYLTQVTTDQRYVSRVFSPNESNWERFVLAIQIEGYVPEGFPLKDAFDDYSPGQWLLFNAPEDQQ